jgi:hypothetical protein
MNQVFSPQYRTGAFDINTVYALCRVDRVDQFFQVSSAVNESSLVPALHYIRPHTHSMACEPTIMNTHAFIRPFTHSIIPSGAGVDPFVPKDI